MMNEQKHTPGPWFAYGRYIGTKTHKSFIGECKDVTGCWTDLRPASANACLIAAAPELLEALRGAIGALEFSRDYHKDLGNEEQAFAQDKLDAALSAIAKAEGKQS